MKNLNCSWKLFYNSEVYLLALCWARDLSPCCISGGNVSGFGDGAVPLICVPPTDQCAYGISPPGVRAVPVVLFKLPPGLPDLPSTPGQIFL